MQQLDSLLSEESYQQYHQLKGHPTRHLIAAKGMVGEHVLNTHAQQKMLHALNATGRAITAYNVSLQ